tara:strand:+ start:2076 stop:2333 length:258 start_codon:yes stop_codon:yes gene_type:complete
MSQTYWFKKRTSALDFGRPASWQGWVALLIAVFLVAILAQMLGKWAIAGFQPLAMGIWVFALAFVVLGAFIKLCNMKSPPPNTDL